MIKIAKSIFTSFKINMKIYFSENTLNDRTFLRGAKPVVKPLLFEEKAQDILDISKKKILTKKQLEKIKKYAQNRPNEVQCIYDVGVRFLKKEISGAELVKQLGNLADTIKSNQTKLRKKEYDYMTEMLITTNFFHPDAVDEPHFFKLAKKFFKKL